MTQICLPLMYKSPRSTGRMALFGLLALLAALAISLSSTSSAQARAPRHVVDVQCAQDQVALVYFHGQYYHRDAWVAWAHYANLDFSQARVYLFPASDFHHGKYVGHGAHPSSKGHHQVSTYDKSHKMIRKTVHRTKRKVTHGTGHGMKYPVKMPVNAYH